MGKSASKSAMEKSRKKKGSSKGNREDRHATSTPTSTSKPAEEAPGPTSTTTSSKPSTDFDDLGPAVVIDNGSYSCKYGLAGESSPGGEVRTIVGRHQSNEDEWFVGNDALNKRSVLDLRSPIQRGLVKNWDDMETVWEYIYRRKLRVEPASCPVVLTEPALNPKANREKMIEIMFERFDVPAFYVIPQSLSTLFTTGKMSGVVVDIGDGVTDIVPIHNAIVVEGSIRRLELAGRDITEYMMKSPAARGEKITYEVGQTMKTSQCEVVDDFDEVTRLQREGQDVHHLYATEALFQPSILGRNHPGVHATVVESLMACEESIRNQIGANVVLAGGSTLFRGFHARLERELVELVPPSIPLQVPDRQDRETLVWSGASLFASLPAFKQHAIGREGYFEVGPEIINRKR